jgi:predicted transcriptional regulator
MPSIKQQVQAVVDALPEDCTIEEVHYRLYVLDKIRRGIRQADAGKTISHSEMLRRVKKWRRK